MKYLKLLLISTMVVENLTILNYEVAKLLLISTMVGENFTILNYEIAKIALNLPTDKTNKQTNTHKQTRIKTSFL